jgi:hypothetical protein
VGGGEILIVLQHLGELVQSWRRGLQGSSTEKLAGRTSLAPQQQALWLTDSELHH